MESKYELKEIGIKNCICYYFGGIVRVVGTDFDILLDEKSCKAYENILLHDIHTTLLQVQKHCILGLMK